MTHKQGRLEKALTATMQAMVLLMALVLIAIALVLLPTGRAKADPYAQVMGGCIWSSDQSNEDELEFGSECGAMVGAEGGYTFDLAGSLQADAGLEAAHRWKNLHGQNGRHKQTADGETLHLTSLMVNGRLRYEIYGPVSIYAEGGAGGAHLRGLDDFTFAPAWQVGAGLNFAVLDNLSINAGYRHFEILDTELDGNQTGADFHGAIIGLRWQFSFMDRLEYLADREPLED